MGAMRVQAFTFGFKTNEKDAIATYVNGLQWLQLIGDAKIDSINESTGVEIALFNVDSKDALDNIKTLMARLPECKVIGIGDSDPEKIIAAMRSGCKQFVSKPIDASDLKSALESVRPTRQAANQCICVIGSSTGAGATTVACNMAVELASLGSSAAVVDLDLEFGGVSCAFDCDPKYTLSEVCSAGSSDSLDRMVVDEAMCKVSGVSILARPNELDQVDQVDPVAVGKALDVLLESREFVVVDLSRINGELGRTALQRADRVFIVVQLNVFCLRNAQRIHSLLTTMGIDDRCIQIIVNRAQSENSLGGAKMESFIKLPVFGYIPNDYSQIRMSFDRGISEEDSSPARLATRDLAAQVAGMPGNTAGARSWMSRMFSRPMTTQAKVVIGTAACVLLALGIFGFTSFGGMFSRLIVSAE